MSRENVELVRGSFEARNRGDFSAVLRPLDPGIEWHTAADEPDADTHRGIEAVGVMLRGWAQSFDDFSVEVLQFIDAGDRVVVPFIARGRPRGSDQTVEIAETQLYTVRDGKVIEVREYRTKEQALEAVGLRE